MDNHWNNETETYLGKYIRDTDAALLFLPEDFEEGEEVWLPKSRIEYEDDDYERGDLIEVEIPNWLAEDKEII